MSCNSKPFQTICRGRLGKTREKDSWTGGYGLCSSHNDGDNVDNKGPAHEVSEWNEAMRCSAEIKADCVTVWSRIARLCSCPQSPGSYIQRCLVSSSGGRHARAVQHSRGAGGIAGSFRLDVQWVSRVKFWVENFENLFLWLETAPSKVGAKEAVVSKDQYHKKEASSVI